MATNPEPKLPHDDVTRLIQEGRNPETMGERMQLAADKMRGKVPLGVDAPNKSVRKAIGGAGSLFIVLKNEFIGVLCVLLGGLFVWAGSNGQFDFRSVAIGVGGLLLGAYCLLRAWRAWQVLKAISRA
jgi:hypothetical protein